MRQPSQLSGFWGELNTWRWSYLSSTLPTLLKYIFVLTEVAFWRREMLLPSSTLNFSEVLWFSFGLKQFLPEICQKSRHFPPILSLLAVWLHCLAANRRPPTTKSLFLMKKLEMPQLLYEVLEGDSMNSLLLLKYIMLFHWIFLKMFMTLIQHQVWKQALHQASSRFQKTIPSITFVNPTNFKHVA